ncbi:MAG: carbohydrate ABC transporter permease [Armatimonadetes bacterium]|nr:carbohydrate ABC transporter permease [Armatimonadota bacterium]
MPIINYTDRKCFKGRALTLFIYTALMLGGLTMVYPFLVMLTGSVSNAFDYERRAPVPRYLVSREDRLMSAVCSFFPPAHRGSVRQMRSYFPSVPDDWSIWTAIGDDSKSSDAWAAVQLARLADPNKRRGIDAQAKDYAEFAAKWDSREAILAYDTRFVSPFLRKRYKTLEGVNKAWQISVEDFSLVSAAEWSGEPIDQAGYVPLVDTRYTDLLAFREAYRNNEFTPFLKGAGVYCGYLRPASVRYLWEEFAGKELGIDKRDVWRTLPMPVPATADAKLRAAWRKFVENGLPLRHVSITVTPERQAAFTRFVAARFRTAAYFNNVMGGQDPTWRPVARFEDARLTALVPDGPLAKVWMDYLHAGIPSAEWRLRDTIPELAFQKLALARHGDLAGVNAAYGLSLTAIEQLGVPFGEALLATFANREWAFTRDRMTGNYATVLDYLLHRGRAVSNTILLVFLAIVIALTVNPLAGYALSRFRLRSGEKVIVFCLATMAFPAAVAAIPGFLLLRDLGLLNTFAALVLPGAANGMTIFMLKGFFDSLPKELYEAASIDGAPEWMVFWKISIPLVKPILALSMLHAFIAAYNGWEWAIIVCQNRAMWTIAVWTYQFSQTLAATPWLVMATFIVNSIPVLIIFLTCQKVIMRGIILPQMK